MQKPPEILGKRHQALDGLRGVACLFIILLHKAKLFQISIYQNDAARSFIDNGYLFVDLFFVLSGFVIAVTYKKKITEGKISISSFLRGRLAKIYPIHFITMSVFIILEMISNRSYMPTFDMIKTTLHQALLIHGIVFSDKFGGWNFPSWFVSVIFWIYLLYALYLKYGERINSLALSLLFLIAIPILITWRAKHGWDTTFKYGIYRGICGFWAGHILANYILCPYFVKIGRYKRTLLEALSFALMAYFLWASSGGNLLAAFFYIPSVMVILSLTLTGGLIGKVLSARPIVRLGGLSYYIYMLHIPVFTIFENKSPLRGDAGFMTATLFTLFAAIAFDFIIRRLSVHCLAIESPRLRTVHHDHEQAHR